RDAGRAGSGDECGGDAGGQLGCADKRGGQRRAAPLHLGIGGEAGAGDGQGEGGAAARGRTRTESGEGGGRGRRNGWYEFVGGDRAIIEDTDFCAAGRGDQGHGGGGEEVAAVDGKGEIRAAHQYRCGAEAGDGRGGRLPGKNGRLGGNQRARIDHLDDVRP